MSKKNIERLKASPAFPIDPKDVAFKDKAIIYTGGLNIEHYITTKLLAALLTNRPNVSDNETKNDLVKLAIEYKNLLIEGLDK